MLTLIVGGQGGRRVRWILVARRAPITVPAVVAGHSFGNTSALLLAAGWVAGRQWVTATLAARGPEPVKMSRQWHQTTQAIRVFGRQWCHPNRRGWLLAVFDGGYWEWRERAGGPATSTSPGTAGDGRSETIGGGGWRWLLRWHGGRLPMRAVGAGSGYADPVGIAG